MHGDGYTGCTYSHSLCLWASILSPKSGRLTETMTKNTLLGTNMIYRLQGHPVGALLPSPRPSPEPLHPAVPSQGYLSTWDHLTHCACPMAEKSPEEQRQQKQHWSSLRWRMPAQASCPQNSDTVPLFTLSPSHLTSLGTPTQKPLPLPTSLPEKPYSLWQSQASHTVSHFPSTSPTIWLPDFLLRVPMPSWLPLLQPVLASEERLWSVIWLEYLASFSLGEIKSILGFSMSFSLKRSDGRWSVMPSGLSSSFLTPHPSVVSSSCMPLGYLSPSSWSFLFFSTNCFPPGVNTHSSRLSCLFHLISVPFVPSFCSSQNRCQKTLDILSVAIRLQANLIHHPQWKRSSSDNTAS